MNTKQIENVKGCILDTLFFEVIEKAIVSDDMTDEQEEESIAKSMSVTWASPFAVYGVFLPLALEMPMAIQPVFAQYKYLLALTAFDLEYDKETRGYLEKFLKLASLEQCKEYLISDRAKLEGIEVSEEGLYSWNGAKDLRLQTLGHPWYGCEPAIK